MLIFIFSLNLKNKTKCVDKASEYFFQLQDDQFDLCFMQNTIIDERGSFAVTCPFPGRLGAILKSLEKVVCACRI